jgi:hypothetical protein
MQREMEMEKGGLYIAYNRFYMKGGKIEGAK